MLELSWEGFIQHTIQGWNIGKPPYGYQPEKIPHPVPARRAEGRTKHRLVPDPVRGPVVTRVYQLRAIERLSYDSIADRLNTDLAANPVPESADRPINHQATTPTPASQPAGQPPPAVSHVLRAPNMSQREPSCPG